MSEIVERRDIPELARDVLDGRVDDYELGAYLESAHIGRAMALIVELTRAMVRDHRERMAALDAATKAQ